MALNMGPMPTAYSPSTTNGVNGSSNGTLTSTVKSLTSRAMLVSLHMPAWSARKFDKDVTRKATDDHNAKRSAGRFNKKLLPDECPEYEAITKVTGQARADHIRMTSPWANDGTRILMSTLYWEYMEIMRKHRNNFETAVAAFVAVYPDMRTRAQTDLGDMFKPEEYPEAGEVSKKFKFSVQALPLPEVHDWRVDLGDEENRRIKAELEKTLASTVESAMREVWARLYKPVKEMAERLAGKTRLMEPSFRVLDELCDVLRHLNMTGDANLASLIDEVQGALTVKPDKADSEARDRAARRAEEIMEKMAAFMPQEG